MRLIFLINQYNLFNRVNLIFAEFDFNTGGLAVRPSEKHSTSIASDQTLRGTGLAQHKHAREICEAAHAILARH